jgi:PAS domain-containing protein
MRAARNRRPTKRPSTPDLQTEPVREPPWIAALFEQLPVGVIITDAAGRIVRANEMARSLRGSCYWPRFGGLTSGDADHPVRPMATPEERLEWELARALLMGETVRDEHVELLGDGGARRWLSVSVTAVPDDDGRIVSGVVTLEDVTARTRLDTLAPALEMLARL